MTSTHPVIRQAAANDIDEVHRLIAALGYPDLDRRTFEAGYVTVLEHPEIRVLIAEDEQGAIVGLASVSHRPQLRLGGVLVSLDELVVAETSRGKGVGRALLDEVKAIAARLGARRLELEQSRGRDSYKRAFYLKNGFTEADSAVLRIELSTAQ